MIFAYLIKLSLIKTKGVFLMEKIITINNLRNFAYCNNQICIKPIKGMVVSFFGLGGATIFNEDTEEGCRYAEKGILYLVPYQNPWAWMNKQTVDYTDELIDVLFKEYNARTRTSLKVQKIIPTIYTFNIPLVINVDSLEKVPLSNNIRTICSENIYTTEAKGKINIKLLIYWIIRN